MGKSAEKTNTGEGDKGKRGRTVSVDVGGKLLQKSLSENSKTVCGQCVGEKSTGAVIHSNVIRSNSNIFESSRKNKTQYFVDVVKDSPNDGLKTVILNSSSGVVSFLTPSRHVGVSSSFVRFRTHDTGI